MPMLYAFPRGAWEREATHHYKVVVVLVSNLQKHFIKHDNMLFQSRSQTGLVPNAWNARVNLTLAEVSIPFSNRSSSQPKLFDAIKKAAKRFNPVLKPV